MKRETKREVMAFGYCASILATAVLELVGDYESALGCLWFALILFWFLYHPHFNR